MRIKLLMLLVLIGTAVLAQDTDPPATPKEVIDRKEEGFFKNLNENISNTDFTEIKSDNIEAKGEETNRYDSVNNDSLASLTNNIKYKIYGRSFIANQAIKYTSPSSLVPPPNYRIGPGDQIAINIWDGPQEQQVYTVDKDGSIFPQFLGKIYVQGLTFENLQSLLKSRYLTIVPRGSKIDVQLVKVRTIKVNVVGEVQNPNAYTVSAFETAINVLALAGGVNDIGSLRNIEVKRNGYTIYTVDVYDFIENGGGIDDNIYLENNDYIVVPVHKKTVIAEGEFVRPMHYQLTDNENLQALLKYTAGLKPNARKNAVSLTRYGDEKKELITVPLGVYLQDEYIDLILSDMDSIYVGDFSDAIVNSVQINGAVQFPGDFELMEGERLYDLLVKAGGLRGDAYLKKAILQRGDSVNISNTFSLDLEDFDQNSESNISLEYGDVVTVFSNADFYTEKYIKILGAVKNPGKYRYTGQLSAKDLILMAGGLTYQADHNSIEVSRIYDTIGVMGYMKTRPNELYTLNITPNLELDTNTENFKLKPFDILTVKSSKNFRLQRVVTILGEVNNPGSYTLDGDGERLSQLLQRAGGLTPIANIANANMRRDTLGSFYCDFENAYNKPGSRWDIFLTDKDTIFIPDQQTYVTISGEVLEPLSTFVNPDFNSIKDYINLAGGLTDKADTKRIYIKYRDGSYAKPKRFWFYKFYPSVSNGGTVIVPRLDPNDTFIQNFGEAAGKAWTGTMRVFTSLSVATSTAVSSLLLYLSLKDGI